MKNWNAFFGTLVIVIGLSVGCGYPIGKYANPMNGRVAKAETAPEPKITPQTPTDLVKPEPAVKATAAVMEESPAEVEETPQTHAVLSMHSSLETSAPDVLSDHLEALQAPVWVKKTMRRKIERIQQKASQQGLDPQLRLIIILAVIAIILGLVAGLLDALTGFWGLWWIFYIAASILLVIALILGLLYLVNEVL